VPGGKRFVVTVVVPPDSVKGPSEPRTVVPSLAKAISETSPVGVPLPLVGATLTVAVKFCPDGVPPLGLVSVVVVVVRMAEVHLLSRFVTLIEPKPVDRSYPVADTNAGVPLSTAGHEGVVVVLQITTPKLPEDVLLQSGVPETQATELFPFVTSLKTHPAVGVCPSDDVHFPPP
jgi:hypothetical protein